MDVVGWLLDSDPAIRWQVLRDLADAPPEAVAAERARVATEGWGARLLGLQQPDGRWSTATPGWSAEWTKRWLAMPPERRGTFFPHWTSSTWSLMLLRSLGVDPGNPAVRRAVVRVREHRRWEHDGQPFFAGEVEPCINGKAVALGAYFGEDVTAIVRRLLGEQMDDGGWNCEQENGSVRGSFHSTLAVLDGLLEYARATGGTDEVGGTLRRGQDYLLDRRLFRRLSTGAVIHEQWTRFAFPTWSFYDVLAGLDHLRAAGVVPDGRADEAVALVRSKRDADGRWALEQRHPGDLHFEMDEGVGRPSRWNTLRALRVLRWYDRAGQRA